MTANTGRKSNVYLIGQKKNEDKEVPAVSKDLLERARQVAQKYGIGTDKRGR